MLEPVTLGCLILLIVAALWVTEWIHVSLTALLVPVLAIMSGIFDVKQAFSAFANPIIFIFLGGFALSAALHKQKLDERIAQIILNISNGQLSKASYLIFGATAMLSMWISNTATVLALLPVAVAIASASDNSKFAIALLLGLAYSASVGGVGTLIGTPPNVIFASVYENFASQEFSFIDWMKIGVPVIIVTIPVIAFWLTRGISLTSGVQLPKMSSWSKSEKRALLVFSLIALLWVFRKNPMGGWSELTGLTQVGDATIALFGALLMAIVPGGDHKGNNKPLLTWEQAKTIPWDMLILFSGGICLAKGFAASGLSELIGQSLSSALDLPILLLLFVLCLSLSFLTEVTSNTATATLFMPILASVALTKGLPLELVMIPAVISCSFAFCLPVATAPNSIVFSSGQLTIKDMAKNGIALNVIGAGLVSFLCWLIL